MARSKKPVDKARIVRHATGGTEFTILDKPNGTVWQIEFDTPPCDSTKIAHFTESGLSDLRYHVTCEVYTDRLRWKKFKRDCQRAGIKWRLMEKGLKRGEEYKFAIAPIYLVCLYGENNAISSLLYKVGLREPKHCWLKQAMQALSPLPGNSGTHTKPTYSRAEKRGIPLKQTVQNTTTTLVMVGKDSFYISPIGDTNAVIHVIRADAKYPKPLKPQKGFISYAERLRFKFDENSGGEVIETRKLDSENWKKEYKE